MPYVLSMPEKPAYTNHGLTGYSLFRNERLDVDYISVVTGHDTFLKCKRSTRLYYVLSGEGYFTIDGTRYGVHPGELVTVPPKVEYSYSGQMTLLMVATPRWVRGDVIATRWNPDVASGGTLPDQPRPWLSRARGAFLRLARGAGKRLALWS